ncbi:MBL fold metallo-hydrolase [Moorena producens JHB]|uniref:MBL fold metallo-hydrolase n=1 Tax=Moorena producens (strain JHB) TaxID=1454205 RepID=A0A9Q9STH8_MOOP1|nr:alkyl sulfatase dimerization domain-containing protein [Moorena producens]WAN69367.1 MBL fold metallo-hydrolase [Moorena producens JHB]
MLKKFTTKPWKWLGSLVAIVATFVIAWMQMSPIAIADSKLATEATKDANKQVCSDLPFTDDTEDFYLAKKGFIDKLADPVVITKESGTVWNLEQYNFLLGDETVPCSPENLPPDPDTVNPSLWRMAQLNMQHGLYEVVPGIYQLRGYDLAEITLVEGDTGWIVIDPLTSQETAKAALELANNNISNINSQDVDHKLPRHPDRTDPLPVSAVIYTHSHVDHYAGIQGIVTPEEIKSINNPEGIPIYAPEGFLEEAVSENVFAGNVMSRRASYMYGNLLPKGETGQVDGGLGKTTSAGTTSLIAPTDIIDHTGQKIKVDGINIIFQNVPGSEAPAEMMFYFPEFHALCAAEDATHTMHNLYTLRGAKVRDALGWANYLSQTIELFGDDVKVVFASHHWPTWDKDSTSENEVVEYLKKQRDLYKYIHDQTLHLANQGYTMLEIAEMLELPRSLATEWYNRGYYGSLNHNVKAVYQYYLGWFDGNPAHLYSLPPEQTGAKYIEYMGGPGQAIKLAKGDFDKGEYRWVAQVMSDVVFGTCKDNLPPYDSTTPSNQDCFDATQLEADALEQLGYQAESGPWRNFFLTGAQELRDGVNKNIPTPASGSGDTIRAMTTDLLFDSLAIRLKGLEAAQNQYTFNMIFPDINEEYLLSVENGVLTYTADKVSVKPNTTIIINRSDLDDVILGETDITEVDFSYGGELEDFKNFLSLLDDFEFWFNIVLP